jgi:hypothetical protein
MRLYIRYWFMPIMVCFIFFLVFVSAFIAGEREEAERRAKMGVESQQAEQKSHMPFKMGQSFSTGKLGYGIGESGVGLIYTFDGDLEIGHKW